MGRRSTRPEFGCKFGRCFCGCKLGPEKIPCSTYLTKETIVQCRACCLELDHDELVVL